MMLPTDKDITDAEDFIGDAFGYLVLGVCAILGTITALIGIAIG